jgi:hypothetical protein
MRRAGCEATPESPRLPTVLIKFLIGVRAGALFLDR